jgi:CubicO group peptidase (beta-lactamase class C family)
MVGRLSLAGRRFPYAVFVGAALMVFFAATACSGSESATSEETTTSPATTSGEATTAEGSVAEVEAAVESAMEENDLKAALVRVTQNGEEVATVVRGESMTGVPATEDMHFRSGAVAISYLGTVLLQLVDEDVVELDDTIDAWLPELPASDRITLRMLANSTSGYVDYVYMDSFIDTLFKDPFRAWTPDELIKMATDEPLLYEPGTNWSYAHTNFVILGEALTAITGKPVDELIHERIVEPLGMEGTESHQTAEIPEPVLHAYSSERDTYEESTFWNPSWTIADGAVMISNIRDLATSARAIGTGELVSSESHEEQIGPSLVGLGGPTDTCPEGVCQEQQPTFYYGIGTVVIGGWVLQNPSFFGYGAVQAYLPSEDLAIATSATLDEDAEVGLNGGQKVFEEIAAVLTPDHPPTP